MNQGVPKKADPGTYEIECDVKNKKADWEPCDFKQFCAKIEAMNRRRRRRGRKMRRQRPRTKSKRSAKRRRDGNDYAADFRDRWNAREIPKTGRKEDYFYHKCAYQDQSKNGTDVSSFSPDHIEEIQVGGKPCSPQNIKWLSTKVNGSIGPHLQGFKPPKHKRIEADCCPA